MLATRLRLLAAMTFFQVSCGTLVAQRPIAPPPHPPLDDIVKECTRLGILPAPKGAELVVLEYQVPRFERHLAFCDMSDASRDYFFGFASRPSYSWSMKVTRVKPAPDMANGLTQDGTDMLGLAINCKRRGWDALAEALYAGAIEKAYQPVMDSLRDAAWTHWDHRLLEPGTDRLEPLRRLKGLLREDPRFRIPLNEYLVSDLELTVAPRKSKPGSIEALIDDLTEYKWEMDYSSPPWAVHSPHNAVYWKVAEKGFDAVPTLIEHVEDRRVTRNERNAGFGKFPFKERVGHVASWLLNKLAADEFICNRELSIFGDGVLAPEAAMLWWGKAQQIGEEQWLLQHVLPKKDGTAEHDDPALDYAEVNDVMLRIIRVKYPDRLPALYRTVLRDRKRTESKVIAQEIMASRLPAKLQAELFLEGSTHKDIAHRRTALYGLARSDPAGFRRLFLKAMERITPGTTIDTAWTESEPVIEVMAAFITDPDCWDALAKATKRVAVDVRFDFLRLLYATEVQDGRTDPAKAERLRLWLGFLNDTSGRLRLFDKVPDKMYVHPAWAYPRLSIRDFVTLQLAYYFGIEVPDNPDRSELKWFLLRALVSHAAEQELARLKN